MRFGAIAGDMVETGVDGSGTLRNRMVDAPV
jgi:hypothetical protein